MNIRHHLDRIYGSAPMAKRDALLLSGALPVDGGGLVTFIRAFFVCRIEGVKQRGAGNKKVSWSERRIQRGVLRVEKLIDSAF